MLKVTLAARFARMESSMTFGTSKLSVPFFCPLIHAPMQPIFIA